MASKERRKRLRALGLEMASGRRGMFLSWHEVGTAASATEAAIKNRPSGHFVSEFLDRLNRRLVKRRDMNRIAIDKEETI